MPWNGEPAPVASLSVSDIDRETNPREANRSLFTRRVGLWYNPLSAAVGLVVVNPVDDHTGGANGVVPSGTLAVTPVSAVAWGRGRGRVMAPAGGASGPRVHTALPYAVWGVAMASLSRHEHGGTRGAAGWQHQMRSAHQQAPGSADPLATHSPAAQSTPSTARVTYSIDP